MTPSKPVRGHGSRYLFLRERAISALILFGDSEKAAQSIGIPSRTYRRWMLREDFVTEVQALREQLRAGVLARLTGLLQECVDGLKEEAKSATKSADRVRAYKALLLLEDRLDHREKLEERMAKIEREMANNRKPGNPTVIVENAENVTVDRDAIAAILADRRELIQRTTPPVVIDAPPALPAAEEESHLGR